MGSYIGEYTGVVDRHVWHQKDAYGCQYPSQDLIGGVKLSALEYGSLMRFINHSNEPNSAMFFVRGDDGVLHVAVAALGTITKGTQLSLDYGDRFWYRREAPKHLGDDVVPVNLIPSKAHHDLQMHDRPHKNPPVYPEEGLFRVPERAILSTTSYTMTGVRSVFPDGSPETFKHKFLPGSTVFLTALGVRECYLQGAPSLNSMTYSSTRFSKFLSCST